MFALLGGAINYIIKATPENKYLASLVVLVSIIFVLIAWYAREFALKAQDRAIRAEEGLRYFIMTGKAFPSELKLSQIIALRFASDAEYLDISDYFTINSVNMWERKEYTRTNSAYLIKKSTCVKLLSTIIPFEQPIDHELNKQFKIHDIKNYWSNIPLVHHGSGSNYRGSYTI
jgi:hypothetical protein